MLSLNNNLSMDTNHLPESSQYQNRFKRFYSSLAPTLKKPKMQASTTAVFSFLAISLFAWYAVRPTAQTIIYLQREIADKTTVNKQMEDKITALIEAQATYETIQERLPVIQQALPYNPDAVQLARQLYRIASISQASVSAIQVPSLPLLSQEASAGAKLAPTKSLVGEFPVTIVLAGGYPNIKSFLNGLLILRRLVTIDSITIKQEGGRGLNTDGLQLSIRLRGYYSSQ
jgi:Tfp pilus assembly protein PilO